MTVAEGRPGPAARAFEQLRRAPELAAERQGLDDWLAAPPDKVLALVAQLDDPTAMPEGAGPVVYACPMHPEVTSDTPGRCPKCGMKLLATTDVTAAHEGHDHDPAAMEHDGGHHDHGHDHHDMGHGTADGIEWEDDMVQVNRLTTTATMHWKFLDRTSGTDSPAIDWQFTVGQRVKIRLVNELESDHPMHHPSTCTGPGGSWSFRATGSGAESDVEGHGAGLHRPGRGHLVRRVQPGVVDGALPHRRAHAERHDVQLQRHPPPAGGAGHDPATAL
jgi:Heavy metal binding domain